MKVLMLNGSCNANGSTRAGLDVMAETFAAANVETEIVTVGPKPVMDCVGCGKCAELKRCVFGNDEVNSFVDKAADADAFVFGTPVYYAHPSGRVLSFLDRVFFSSRLKDGYAAFRHKPCASIVVARRSGTTASFDVMNKYYGLAQMLMVGSTYWNVFHALAKDDVPHDADGLQTLRNLANNIVYAMRCIQAGREAGIAPPVAKEEAFTNFIR